MKTKDLAKLLGYSNPSRMEQLLAENKNIPVNGGELTVSEIADVCAYYKNNDRASEELQQNASKLLSFLSANPNPTDAQIRDLFGRGSEQPQASLEPSYNEPEPDNTPLSNQSNEMEQTPHPPAQPAAEKQTTKKQFDWMLLPITLVLLLVMVIQAFYFAVVEHHYSKDSFVDLLWLTQEQKLKIAFAVGLAFEFTAVLLAVSSRKESKKEIQGYGSNRKEVTRMVLDGTFWWLLVFSIFGLLINCIFYGMDNSFVWHEALLAAAKPGSIFAFGHLFAKKIRK